MESSDVPIPEREVLVRWKCLTAYRLKRARDNNEISWVPGSRHSAWYRPCAVEVFIANVLEKPCRAPEKMPYSNSPANGSRGRRGRHSSTDIGLSQDLGEHVALRFAQQI
jgi:hypothetical protein